MKRLIIMAAVSFLASTSLEAQLRTTDQLSELANAVKILQSQVSALQTKNNQLSSELIGLQTQLSGIAGFTKVGSNYTLNAGTGNVVIQGGTLRFESPSSILIKSSDTTVEGVASLALKGSSTSLEGGGILNLKGALIRLNNGLRPVLSSPATGNVNVAGVVAINPQATTVMVP